MSNVSCHGIEYLDSSVAECVTPVLPDGSALVIGRCPSDHHRPPNDLATPAFPPDNTLGPDS